MIKWLKYLYLRAGCKKTKRFQIEELSLYFLSNQWVVLVGIYNSGDFPITAENLKRVINKKDLVK
jgi:hypothetical protein